MTFHYQLMQALDNRQQRGAYLTPLHRKLREALRQANMKGIAYASPEALVAAVAPKAWALHTELKRAA